MIVCSGNVALIEKLNVKKKKSVFYLLLFLQVSNDFWFKIGFSF